MPETRVITVEVAGQRYTIRSKLDTEYVAELAAYVDNKIRVAADAAPASDGEKWKDIYFKNNIIDYLSKYGFFCRLGDAAICCMQKHGDNKEKILNSVLSEAFIILEELMPGKEFYN